VLELILVHVVLAALRLIRREAAHRAAEEAAAAAPFRRGWRDCFDAALADATGLAPGFFDTVAIGFFPVGFGLAAAGFFEPFGLALLADFTVFLDAGFCGALRAALPARLGVAL